MSTSKRPRKAYRPRPIALDTMAIALGRAAKPAQADRNEVLGVLRQAHIALREGVATELQWSIVAGGVDVAKAIERQGIVRGLSEHLAAAEAALQAIYDRAMHVSGRWFPTPLNYTELDALRDFVDLHSFQINQLGRAEFLAAIDTATGQIRANGGTPTLVRNIERMTA